MVTTVSIGWYNIMTTDSKPFDNVRERLKTVTHSFDHIKFYDENRDLVNKYLRKNTLDLEIPDHEDVPEDWYYKGQEGILRHGIHREFTILQKLESIKCSLSVNYFTRKYVKIISIDDGIIPFELYEFQHELLELYQNNRFVISMQARQTGKTQTTASYLAWFGIFHQAKTCAILANKADQAQEILSRIQLSYESLPMFIQPGVRTYNKRKIVLSTNSTIFSAASSSSSIRGKSISLLYIDEAAFIPGDMEFYESTYPTIASGKNSQVIITSTPNGTRGLFHKLWKESEEGINDYVRMLVTWDKVPGRDKEWKRQTIANTSPEQFRQEHECIFRGSQFSLLPGHVLEELHSKTPIDYKNDLNIYEYPQPDHTYIASCDVSRGTGNDYHAMSMIDITSFPYKLVATYRNNKLSPLLYPNLIYNVALEYNEAHVIIETNDIGEQVANQLYFDLEYENVIMSRTEKGRKVIGHGNDATPGVRTTTPVKAIGCSTLRTMIEKEKLIINDMTTIDELGTFVPKGKSYEADSGAHDDTVMTLVIFAWATTQNYFIELTDQDFRNSLVREQEERAFDEMLPFGIIDSDAGEFSTPDMNQENSLGVF